MRGISIKDHSFFLPISPARISIPFVERKRGVLVGKTLSRVPPIRFG
jgi:hypothetical protein